MNQLAKEIKHYIKINEFVLSMIWVCFSMVSAMFECISFDILNLFYDFNSVLDFVL